MNDLHFLEIFRGAPEICFYGIFDPFLPKISEKLTEKNPTYGERGGVKPRGLYSSKYQYIHTDKILQF